MWHGGAFVTVRRGGREEGRIRASDSMPMRRKETSDLRLVPKPLWFFCRVCLVFFVVPIVPYRVRIALCTPLQHGCRRSRLRSFTNRIEHYAMAYVLPGYPRSQIDFLHSLRTSREVTQAKERGEGTGTSSRRGHNGGEQVDTLHSGQPPPRLSRTFAVSYRSGSPLRRRVRFPFHAHFMKIMETTMCLSLHIIMVVVVS